MAQITVNATLKNVADGYLLDAKSVKGGYGVVAAFADLASLPNATITAGSLYYCTGDSKFYQYNDGAWAEKVFAASTNSLTTAEVDSALAYVFTETTAE